MVFLMIKFFIYANLELPFYLKKVIFGRVLHTGWYFWWVNNSPEGKHRLIKADIRKRNYPKFAGPFFVEVMFLVRFQHNASFFFPSILAEQKYSYIDILTHQKSHPIVFEKAEGDPTMSFRNSVRAIDSCREKDAKLVQ